MHRNKRKALFRSHSFETICETQLSAVHFSDAYLIGHHSKDLHVFLFLLVAPELTEFNLQRVLNGIIILKAMTMTQQRTVHLIGFEIAFGCYSKKQNYVRQTTHFWLDTECFNTMKRVRKIF